LENNFSNWQKRNPEKSLEDFKQLICVTDEEVQKINAAANSKKRTTSTKSSKYWIGFAIAFVALALLYGIGKFGGDAIMKLLKSEKTSEEVLSRKWVKTTYGDYGLIVETPAALTKGDLPIPDHIRQMIDKLDSYNYIAAKGFKIMINSVTYNPAVGSLNLQGAANGSANEAKMQKGVTDFNYTEDYIYKDSIPGFIQKGSFKIEGVEAEFINAGFASGFTFWQVWVAYQKDDEVGRIAANRVIESIEIKINNKAQ
jgi:hypothetical protein